MDSSRYVVVLVLIVVAAVGGFLVGRGGETSNQTPTTQEGQTSQVLSNPLLKSQTATFQGEITAVSGQNLEVKSDGGQTGSFPVSSRLVVYKYTVGSTQASASSELKSIETGKQALVMLELLDNKYQVVSVSYLPPPPKP